MSKLIPYSEYPNKNEYLERTLNPKYDNKNIFPPKLIMSGMIDWKDEEDASNWAGPWDKRYVGCKIENYSLTLDLPTIAMIKEEERKFWFYNSSNIRRDVFRRIFKDHPDFPHEYDKQTKNAFYLIMKATTGQECSRMEMTQEEVDYFLANATEEEKRYREMEIENKTKNLNLWKETPTKEFPVKIYLFGNDDLSYSKVCYNVKEAEKIVNEIIEKPKMKYIYDNFVFTN